MKNIQVLMINDKTILNDLYRGSLISLLKKKFSIVHSCGLFDSKKIKIFILFKILHPKVIVISSNLRSNIFSLLFFWKKGAVILNGLGTYRKTKLLRVVLLVLFSLNWKKTILIQSYADYRFFRIKSKKKYFWIPGSGGYTLKSGPKENFILISRDKKIQRVFKSTCEFLKIMKNRRITVVGCNDKKKLKHLFKDYKINIVDYQHYKNIFLEGGGFVQPSGHGEGFPQSLAHAIVSGLDIYIDTKEFLRYGLRSLGGEKIFISSNWCRLSGLTKIAKIINDKEIAKKYFDIISKNLSYKN